MSFGDEHQEFFSLALDVVVIALEVRSSIKVWIRHWRSEAETQRDWSELEAKIECHHQRDGTEAMGSRSLSFQ